jgi:hypothetical protein
MTRPRFLPSDRAFLAALLHRLPEDVLGRFRLLVRPDTVLRWQILPGTLTVRGPSMISEPVARAVTDLTVTQSHSRPRVSNDNPFSEAQFKTLKYHRDFPDWFGSHDDAVSFTCGFFTGHNTEHRHSDIATTSQTRCTMAVPARSVSNVPWYLPPLTTGTQTLRSRQASWRC